MQYVLLQFIFILVFAGNYLAQKNPLNMPDTTTVLDKIFLTHEATYTGEFAGNLTGGKKTGGAYLGMANIKIGFETKTLGLWEGGEFFLNGASTHGGTPSEKLIGDFQVASNIEAGNRTYLHELWYKHSYKNFQAIVGLQDLNSEFVTSEYAGNFINSSFGIPSLIADNIPVPIFPLTALGITARYEINESMAIQAAVFDGLPEDSESNQYNLNWDLKSSDGVLVFSELQFSIELGDLPGKLKAGYYYHSHLRETCPETKIVETVFDKNYGFYAIADQNLLKSGGYNILGIFAQFAISPTNINAHNYYFGGGINYQIVSDNGTKDLLGIAIAHAGFSNKDLRNETTVEMFYKAHITENLFFQPDIQYIVNPAGTENNLRNSVAAFLRFGINF